MSKYFYYFLEPYYPELANILLELEGAIFTSPRSMLTHSRTLIENILERVMDQENLPNEPYLTIIERIEILEEEEIINKNIKRALDDIRKYGNMAAHDIRPFRYSEALITWENIYTVIKWFVEVYGDYKIRVPEYVDPKITEKSIYDLEEINIRFQRIEDLLKNSLKENQSINNRVKNEAYNEITSTTEKNKSTKTQIKINLDIEPGYTPVRTISFKENNLEIPYFLRDVFLLPQRFPKSERFLLRLNHIQEARIMSELPSTLDKLHNKVPRYNETHTQTFFLNLNYLLKKKKDEKN